MRIAIDVMGGDQAPEIPVKGGVAAAREWPEITVMLVGREQDIYQVANQPLPRNIKVVHAEDVIETAEEPVRAVRQKQNASLVRACALVRDGKADATISAGNTGALMAAGLFVTGRVRGIKRPALGPIIPALQGQGTLVLDVGANADAKPEHLAQYGLMGSIYAEKVRGAVKPRVGLLNIGGEDAKGSELTKAAFRLLEQTPVNFVGNVEAREVPFGPCDVLVCDGFSGNVLLKSMEGTASAIFSALREEMTRGLPQKLAAAVLKPGLKTLKAKMDYAEYGGAPLLGVKGAVIKSHGSSNETAVKNAVDQARKFVGNRVIAHIKAYYKESE